MPSAGKIAHEPHEFEWNFAELIAGCASTTD